MFLSFFAIFLRDSSLRVDPLASNKGFWAEVLGVGDFYYELAVQIVEICLATRSVNGGLMALPVKNMHARVRVTGPADETCCSLVRYSGGTAAW